MSSGGFRPLFPLPRSTSRTRETISLATTSKKTVAIGGRTTTTLKAGLFGEQSFANKKDNAYILPTSDWQIYVDQSKASLDRGGGAIFDAFFSLCDVSEDDFDSNETDAATYDAVEVQVIPAILPKPTGGGKGPWIRCIWNTNNQKNRARPSPNLDVSNVDSVEKVYRVLTKHLGVTNLSLEPCECLKWKHKGNTYIESGQIKLAIDAYNQALTICEDHAASILDPNTAADQQQTTHNSIVLKQQEGIVLLLRASAFLQQAQSHKEALKTILAGDDIKLPSSEIMRSILLDALFPSTASVSPKQSSSPNDEQPSDKSGDDGMDDVVSKADGNDGEEATTELPSEADASTVENGSEHDNAESPSLSSPHADVSEHEDPAQGNVNDPQTAIRLSVLRKLTANANLSSAQLPKIQYRHGLYQTSLLQAARDSLRATEVLPSYPMAWVGAGDVLSDLWKIKESKQYYEKALSIDESLEERLATVLEGLEARQELIDRTRANTEWPEDSVQLALDLAG